jgi:hypothetical protein
MINFSIEIIIEMDTEKEEVGEGEGEGEEEDGIVKESLETTKKMVKWIKMEDLIVEL